MTSTIQVCGKMTQSATCQAFVDEQAGDDAGETDDRADREVDAAGQDDEGHADGEDAVERRLLDEDLDVGASEEGTLHPGEEQHQHDERDEGATAEQELGDLGPGHAARLVGLRIRRHWITSTVPLSLPTQLSTAGP